MRFVDATMACSYRAIQVRYIAAVTATAAKATTAIAPASSPLLLDFGDFGFFWLYYTFNKWWEELGTSSQCAGVDFLITLLFVPLWFAIVHCFELKFSMANCLLCCLAFISFCVQIFAFINLICVLCACECVGVLLFSTIHSIAHNNL